jgi:hypothetical protein
MEETVPISTVPASPISVRPVAEPMVSGTCPQCHQPVLSMYYFCPNCGKKLTEAPLSTSMASQFLLYGFSIVLPIICYLAIGYWQGIRYMQSADPRAKQIGVIALVLLLVSSAITFWIGMVWIQNQVQSAVNSVGNVGGF